MARNVSEKSVSLFPFLAVLICAMGALILLLLLTTRRIQKQQQTESAADSALVMDSEVLEDSFGMTVATEQPSMVEEEPTDAAFDELPTATAENEPVLALQLPDLEEPDEFDVPDFDLDKPDVAEATAFELKVKIDRLTEVLNTERQRHADLLQEIEAAELKLSDVDSPSDLQQQASRLSDLKQQEAILRSQLSDQQLTLANLEGELDRSSETTEEAERILQVRESALVDLRKLATGANLVSTVGKEKTVLEFSNATGTSQRPIVIEVNEQGFRFSPSEVLVNADQLEGVPQKDNPLLAGIVALHAQADASVASARPYVLLLVRPNGALSFYSAQRTLKNAEVNFGYELVEQEQSFFVRPPIAREQEVVQAAVDAAIYRRNKLYGGVLAELKRLRELREDESTPGARLMPDGRIAVPGENDFAQSGRFFAGGEQPPVSDPVLERDNADSQQPTPMLESLASSERPDSSVNPFEAADTARAEQSAVEESLLTNADSATNESLPLSSTIREPVNPFAQRELSLENASSTGDAAEVASRSQIEELFRQNTGKSGNADVDPSEAPLTESLLAGFDKSETDSTQLQLEASVIPQDDALPATNFEDSVVRTAEPLPKQIDLNWLDDSSSPPQHTLSDLVPILEPGSQTPPDWSAPATATVDAASRTVGAAENLAPEHSGDAKPVTPGFMATLEANASEDVVPTLPPSYEADVMSDFLKSLDAKLDTNQPDPFLVSLLESSQEQQPVATKSNAAPPNVTPPSRHRVTVTLYDGRLQVGSLRPIEISGTSAEGILNVALEGLATQMEAIETADGKFAMPTVDYRCDTSSQRLQAFLQRELEKMDVTTHSTSKMRVPLPHSKPRISSRPRHQSAGPKPESATPKPPSPPVRSGGGLSL